MPYYNKQTHTAYFTSPSQILKFINVHCTHKVDELSGRCSLAGVRFTDVDGKWHSYNSPSKLFTALRDVFKLPVDVMKSRRRGLSFLIRMDDSFEYKEEEVHTNKQITEDLKNAPSLTESLISLDVDQGAEETHETVKQEDTTSDTVAPDWDYVASIKNNKYGKKELETYAKDKFDVELDCRRSLVNMIGDFKTATK